jgi:predicted transcriptional regulator
MARRGVRQADIAATLGVTQQAVSGKLAGRRPFTDHEIAAVAERLGVAPGVLFESHIQGGAA